MNNVEKTLKLIEDSINKKCNGLECKVVKNNIDLRLENIQLKKQIDLMADSFAEGGFYNEYCQTLIDNELCPNDCNKCVKQYFEELAKEKGK